MSQYLFIESRHASESGDVDQSFELAASLAADGHKVTVYLVQNGVISARNGAKNAHIAVANNAGVTVLADDFSLRERGIDLDHLAAGVCASALETVIDHLESGAKTVWH